MQAGRQLTFMIVALHLQDSVSSLHMKVKYPALAKKCLGFQYQACACKLFPLTLATGFNPFAANRFVFLMQFFPKVSLKKRPSRPKLLLLRTLFHVIIHKMLELKQL